jgi:hypothetical protein
MKKKSRKYLTGLFSQLHKRHRCSWDYMAQYKFGSRIILFMHAQSLNFGEIMRSSFRMKGDRQFSIF